MQNTWSQMFNYLIQQKNCRVNGMGFRVVNLHDFLEKMKSQIELHEPNSRSGNMNCRVLKDTLEMVYLAHKKGVLEPANTVHHKPHTNYGG